MPSAGHVKSGVTKKLNANEHVDIMSLDLGSVVIYTNRGNFV